MIQNFDPIGVASRDLRECLLVQAKALGYEDTDPEVLVIKRHIHHLEKHNYQAISKDMKIPLEEVYEAAKEIQTFESRPARNFTDQDERSIGITPDVYVIKDTDGFRVLDNDRGIQRLFINESLTKRLMQDPSAKEFIGEKLRNAQWLIRAIEQRRKTIIRVAECIVEKQREFFEKGVAHLKPMILRDVAEAVSMHESTISRVTTNKYMHTPRGVFEFRYFFSSHLAGEEGEQSSTAVRAKIRKLVSGEDPDKPLSDNQIAQLLSAGGVTVARRTVAKYREAMKIPSSSDRKRNKLAG
jgi:RNA polymerase sigma-54 factor